MQRPARGRLDPHVHHRLLPVVHDHPIDRRPRPRQRRIPRLHHPLKPPHIHLRLETRVRVIKRLRVVIPPQRRQLRINHPDQLLLPCILAQRQRRQFPPPAERRQHPQRRPHKCKNDAQDATHQRHLHPSRHVKARLHCQISHISFPRQGIVSFVPTSCPRMLSGLTLEFFFPIKNQKFLCPVIPLPITPQLLYPIS